MCGSDGKESAVNSGDPSWAPGLRRSLGESHSNPLQSSCLENPMDRGAWRPTVLGVARVRHDWVTNTGTALPGDQIVLIPSLVFWDLL